MPNRLNYNRFSIVIGAKSVENNIHRNFFRRFFYDLTAICLYTTNTKNKFSDFTFVVKKQTKLCKSDEKNLANFQNDVDFLLKKTLKTKK